jgi:hypothetical protein
MLSQILGRRVIILINFRAIKWVMPGKAKCRCFIVPLYAEKPQSLTKGRYKIQLAFIIAVFRLFYPEWIGNDASFGTFSPYALRNLGIG